MMSRTLFVAVAVVSLAAAGVAWRLWSNEDTAAPAAGVPIDPTATADRATMHADADVAPTVDEPPRVRGIGKTGVPPKGAVTFPDGTWLMALNGVTDPPPFPGFHNGQPYAPVIEIYTTPGNGMQWYLHVDGTRSTTQMVVQTEGGREFTRAGWAVGHPSASRPVR